MFRDVECKDAFFYVDIVFEMDLWRLWTGAPNNISKMAGFDHTFSYDRQRLMSLAFKISTISKNICAQN